MKIAMLVESLLLGYGVDLVVDRLSTELAKQGSNVDVFLAQYDAVSSEYRTYIAQSPYAPNLTENPIKCFFVNIRKSLEFLKRLNRYDLLVTHNYHLLGAMTRVLENAPVIQYQHGVAPVNAFFKISDKINSAYASSVLRISSLVADRILVNSNFVKNKLPRWAKNKSFVNYCGAEHMAYYGTKKDLATFRNHLGINNSPTILWVGRFAWPYKRISLAIQSYKKLKREIPKLKLIIAGRGTENAAKPLRNINGTLILKNISNEELKKCYALCDVFISTTQWEGFNLPLVEAQANAKPVVAYEIGAHPEVVKHEKTGFLAKNDEEFTDFTLKLLNDNNLRQSMGTEAAHFSRRFNWNSHVKLFKSVADKLVN